jgi:hypothetical protein
MRHIVPLERLEELQRLRAQAEKAEADRLKLDIPAKLREGASIQFRAWRDNVRAEAPRLLEEVLQFRAVCAQAVLRLIEGESVRDVHRSLVTEWRPARLGRVVGTDPRRTSAEPRSKKGRANDVLD